MKFTDERSMQEYFCKKLRESGWLVKDDYYDEENWSENGDVRIDVLGYHKSFGDWFGFELKNFAYQSGHYNSFGVLTRALKQMYDRYKNQTWKNIGKIKLFSLILPNPLSQTEYPQTVKFVTERFFWRFGFGVGDCVSMTVAFNQTQKYTLNLLKPNKSKLSTPWKYTSKEKIAEILKIVATNE